jgi:hypothetical protein
MKKKSNKLETLHVQKERRRFYQVGDIKRDIRPHIKECGDNNGLILNETPIIMNRWK